MKALLLAAIATIAALATSTADPRLPNIVVFLADDFGYGCINSYGADEQLVRTPHIDRLAAQGTRFTNAYTTGSVCSPTRYAMLTGEYSWRTAMKRGVVNSNDPLLIDPQDPTLASWLQGQGYQTAQVGKWHLGYGAKRFKNLLGPIAPGPLDVGFDYHFGVPNNLDDLHKIYIENDRIHGLRSDKISPYGKSFYGKPYVGYDAPQRITEQVMDTLVTKSIDWIDHRDPAKPFFLYFASVAVHHPITPSARMRGTSAAGAYGDFIHDVDYAMGQLQQALAARGLDENTLIIFTSDNGSDIPADPNRPEAQAVAKGLAVNGTLRGDKHTIYEGGFKVPFIVRQPGETASAKVSDQRVSTVDIFATITDIVAPKSAPNSGRDSVSFIAQLDPTALASPRPPLVLRDANGRKALLFDQWKYIDDQAQPLRGKKPVKLKPELYDLSRDPSETNNLSKAHPDQLAAAHQLLATIQGSD